MAEPVPELTVVVTAGGRPTHLRRTLAALTRNDLAFELVVVDVVGDIDAGAVDAATGSTMSRVLDCPPVDGCVRLSAARNMGARAARSQALVFLDVDCLVGPRALEDYLSACRRYPHALVAGPVRYLGRGWDSGAPRGVEVGGEGRWAELSAPAPRPPVQCDRVAGATEFDLFWSLSFGCSVATFARIGGFDEGYVGYGAEDTDFGRRARAAGVGLVWTPSPTAYHQWHEPARFDPEQLPSIVRNPHRIRRQWGDWPMPDWFDELARDAKVRWQPELGVLRVLEPEGVLS